MYHYSQPTTPIRVSYNGRMTDMQIVPDNEQYGLMLNDHIIAKIQRVNNWQQVSGQKLDKDTFEEVVDRIIGFYE